MSVTQTATVGRIRGLCKHYGGAPVVDGLDLDLRAGECFALLGPNGAGKTTTVEILEGFRHRDAGEVEILECDPQTADLTWRARIGVVAQTTLGAVDLTVGETVDHFARYHADPWPNAELIALVGLEQQTGDRVPTLSGGQRRRLDVALGIQGHPELLFLDEPTTGFDPVARRQFWSLLEELKRDGTTIVLTTHYLDEAARLADRLGVIVAGRLVEVATVDELANRSALGTRVSWTASGRRHSVVTSTPTAVLREALAEVATGELGQLEVVRPSLEDVYLALVDGAQP